MKLVTFQTNTSQEPLFGLVINEKFVVSFAAIMKKQGTFVDSLESMDSYLHYLPASYDAAKELMQYAVEHLHQFNENEISPIAAVNLLPPVPNPAALIDFGLTPRHLRNAGVNLLQREYTGPEREELKQKIAEKFQQDPNKVNFSYYKCNHNALIGDGDTIHWPSYSSYLDIEPELAFVTGKGNCIAGYVIFNDSTVRDVQWPDFQAMTGPTRCKDFDRSKGIGPFLVTPDEIDNPLALDVDVLIGERLNWKGSTSEYCAHPAKVMEEVLEVFTPLPGTIIGMGTIPDCCAIETEEWLLPSDRIQITFDKLGTLTQLVPDHVKITEPSRWEKRSDLP
ncbi:fumarylacetoacetate hydrolase family protein [Paenibacillus sp. ClWae2A]|uniref:fumarylacetoacetate hydrolase family protein n=1 Tax=Paenibacillus sp. ClWae2A TaxID=3057177 RepID=UPI0028F62C0D|nr:fumarylacetoacetate hydrolase family protein [Paenibacillus sp. ClWae2A]MDT9717897.1 fumarylacetoacetate hydrolase family protein [Paenibacillus sp. ClWae2A]